MKSYFTTLFLSVATAMIMLIPACDCGESKVLEGTDALYPVEVNDKWGFIDCEGNMVIEPRFYNAGQFSDGLAPACVGDWLEHKWGYINTKGEFVIKPQYIEAEVFEQGMARVAEKSTNWRGWQYTIINTKGETLFSWNLDEPDEYGYELSEGLMHIRKYDNNGKEAAYGYIDKNGKMVVDCRFSMAQPFKEGLAAVCIGYTGAPETGRWGYINHKGEMEIGAHFFYADRFSEGLAAVKTEEGDDGKWGYINKKGEMVIEPKYSEARPFCHGLAAVRVGDMFTGKWGYINQEGKMVIAPKFSNAQDFSEGGLAEVWVGEAYSNEGQNGFIDATGRFVIKIDNDVLSKVAGFELNSCQGSLTKDGKLLVVTMSYEFWQDLIRNTTSRWGYMNMKGEFVWLSEIEKSQMKYELY